MGKTQVLGALFLALLTAGEVAGTVCATDYEPMEASQVNCDEQDEPSVETTQEMTQEVRRSKELDLAIRRAKEAQAYAGSHPSTIYPGIEKYIARIVAWAEQGKGTEAQALEALNDAVELTYKLLDNNTSTKTQSVTLMRSNQDEAQEENKIEKVQTEEQVAQVQAAEPEAVSVVKAQDVKLVAEEDNKNETPVKAEDEVPESGDDIVELPNTGGVPEHKAGSGELVVAGIVVLLVTTGAVALVIRSKRDA